MGAVQKTWACPCYEHATQSPRAFVEAKDPERILEMLTRLGKIILQERQNDKRGLDLGVGRGYSGKQAAKQLIGLAAAKAASGPGKRTLEDFSLHSPLNPI